MEDPSPQRHRTVAAFKRFARLARPRTRFIVEIATANGFSAAEWSVISELLVDRSSGVLLAHRLGIEEAYISRLVSRWALEGFVEIQPNPRSRRRRDIVLTDAGQAAARDLDGEVEAAIDHKLCFLSQEDGQRLLKALETLDAVFARLDANLAWFSLSQPRRPRAPRPPASATPG